MYNIDILIYTAYMDLDYWWLIENEIIDKMLKMKTYCWFFKKTAVDVLESVL